MKGLISRKSYRLLNILDYVLRERKQIDIDEVMSMNHCSKKTVYNDLEEIKERIGLDLSDFYYDDTNNTYNVYQFMIMKRKVLHHETSIHLLVELFFNPNQDLVDLSLATGKSESNVRTHLSRLEKYVKEHRLQLVYDKEKKYRLDFDHLFSASLFISDLIRIAGHESYLPPIPQERLEKALFFEKGSSLIEKDFQRMYHTLISAQHLYPQFPIVSLEEFVKPYKEKIQIYLATEREALQKFVIDHKLDLRLIHPEHVMTILISAYIKKDLQPHRVDVLMNRYDYFYLDASVQKPQVIEIFREFMGTFFIDEMSLGSYETEVFFNLYNEIGSIQKIETRLIGVYSDIGHAHAQTLCQEIKKTFSGHEAEAYDPLKKYDLIVSTSFLPKAPQDTPVVLIDDYINPLEVQQIYTALYQNTYKTNQKEGSCEESIDRR